MHNFIDQLQYVIYQCRSTAVNHYDSITQNSDPHLSIVTTSVVLILLPVILLRHHIVHIIYNITLMISSIIKRITNIDITNSLYVEQNNVKNNNNILVQLITLLLCFYVTIIQYIVFVNHYVIQYIISKLHNKSNNNQHISNKNTSFLQRFNNIYLPTVSKTVYHTQQYNSKVIKQDDNKTTQQYNNKQLKYRNNNNHKITSTDNDNNIQPSSSVLPSISNNNSNKPSFTVVCNHLTPCNCHVKSDSSSDDVSASTTKPKMIVQDDSIDSNNTTNTISQSVTPTTDFTHNSNNNNSTTTTSTNDNLTDQLNNILLSAVGNTNTNTNRLHRRTFTPSQASNHSKLPSHSSPGNLSRKHSYTHSNAGRSSVISSSIFSTSQLIREILNKDTNSNIHSLTNSVIHTPNNVSRRSSLNSNNGSSNT